MSLNKKKSRKISVNDTEFRWQVVSKQRSQDDPECTDGPSIYYRPCHLYIELAEEAKSQIKLLYFYKYLYIDPGNEKVFEYVKPKLVAEVIKESLDKGWDPYGTQHFNLTKKEEKVYSQAEERKKYHEECQKRLASLRNSKRN